MSEIGRHQIDTLYTKYKTLILFQNVQNRLLYSYGETLKVTKYFCSYK